MSSKIQKQLLVTFDYELFLGNRSGFVDDCMIEPTNKLIAILDKFAIRAIFFVDTTCLLRMKEQAAYTANCATDLAKISEQLRTLVRKGHYVFPHVHPHWLDADYIENNNQWRLNGTEKYCFRNISQSDRAKVFNGSVALLEEILHSEFPAYKINAFRAGGWSIQPFTDFLPFFKHNNFKYEFSVLGGFYQFTDAQYFDFSTAPVKNIYRFQDDVCIENTGGNFTQFNISSIQIPSTINLLNKIFIKLHSKITGDHTFNKGEGQPSRILNTVLPASPKGKNISASDWERVAIELLTAVKLNDYLAFMDRHEYMHFISHPKMITSHNLATFEKFLKKTFAKYNMITDFHEMIPVTN